MKYLTVLILFLLLVPAMPGRAQAQDEDEEQDQAIGAPIPTETGTSERFAAGDWGVSLDAQDSTRFADHLEQDVRGRAAILGIFGRRVIPFSTENELDLAVEGSYNWSRADIFVNLDLMRATVRLPEMFSPASTVELSAGRFPFQDPSGLVLRHTGDGLQTRIATPRTRVTLGAMYTGLLLNPVSNIRMSGIDRFDETDEDETFGPRRVVGMASFRFPELIGRQALSLSLIGQADVRDTDTGEDSVHSAYAVLGLDGRLFGQLYSDIYGGVTAGIYDDGDDDDTYIGFMGSARLRLFLPELRRSRISVRGVYMSNDDDPESFDAFRPISRSTPGTVVSIPLENIIFGELIYSMRPFAEAQSLAARRVQLSLAGRTFFTASDSPPASEPFGSALDGQPVLVQADPDGNYVGTEAAVRLNARVRSDLGLAMTGGVFFPGTGSNGVFENERKEEFLVRVELSTRL